MYDGLRNRREASLRADGQLIGSTSDTSEQVILDASDPVLMLDIEDVPDPNPPRVESI